MLMTGFSSLPTSDSIRTTPSLLSDLDWLLEVRNWRANVDALVESVGFLTLPVRMTVWLRISTLIFDPAIKRLRTASRPAVSRSTNSSNVAICSPDVSKKNALASPSWRASRNTRFELKTTASTAAGFETMTSRMSRGNSIRTDFPTPILRFFRTGIGSVSEILMKDWWAPIGGSMTVGADKSALALGAGPAAKGMLQGIAARNNTIAPATGRRSMPTLFNMVFCLMTTIDLVLLS